MNEILFSSNMFFLCLAAFSAGFVDAIVGGGGLIQTPASLVLLPQYPVSTVIGTLKIPAFSGTFFASIQYARRVKFDFRFLAMMCIIAFTSAYAGSRLLVSVSNSFMKPVILIVLIVVGIYTFTKKNFGTAAPRDVAGRRVWLYAALISVIIGFYDGFIGPGAGSFLVLAFISVLGYDFIRASAHAKFVNLSTNLGSILFFSLQGKILFFIAIPMAIANALGGIVGARLALLRGNSFIRVFFLIVVSGTILRFAYDILFK